MQDPTKTQALDRHALVMTLWLSCGLMAITLFHYGIGGGGALFILAGFGMILLGFIGHIIVNAALGSHFTVREKVFGLVLYGAGAVAFGFATLLAPDFREHAFVPASAGFLLIFASIVFYMIAHFGLRRSFEGFDVIRSFSTPSPGPKRGGAVK